jgi:hypothetical protein
MKFRLILSLTLLLALNACKSDKTSDAAQKAIESGAGIAKSTADSANIAYAAKLALPSGALPEIKKEYCFGAGKSVLKIKEENSTITGTYSAYENGENVLNGKYFGAFQNDTIKGMVLSLVNKVGKVQDIWFKKDGDNYIVLNGKTTKDDKGAFKLDIKSLKPGEILTAGTCK